MKTLSFKCLLLISLLMGTHVYLFSEEITSVIPVAEDADVRSDNKVSPPAKLLVYNNSSGGLNIDTYLKFDISAFSSISSATLKLTIAGYSQTGRNAAWKITIAGSDWTESTISSSRRPVDTGTEVAALAATLGGKVTGSTNQWMEETYTLIPLDIPLNISAIQDYFAAGNKVITFRIRLDAAVNGGGEINLAAREAEAGTFGTGTAVVRTDLVGQGPKLEVTGTLETQPVTLSDLKINGTTPGEFYTSRANYTIYLDAATTYPSITPAATDPAAVISEITYNPKVFDPNATAHNTATFTVTNGNRTATYTLVFMNEEFGLLIQRIQTENEKSYDVVTLANTVAGHLNKFSNVTSAFNDIDYNDTEGRLHDWYALTHIDRLKDMVFAYTMPNNNYYQNDDLYNKIIKLLTYWANNHPPENTNWWHNDIPEPQRLGILLIQMRKGKEKVPATLESKLITDRMKPGRHRGQAYFTGANRVDIATHWVYGACLNRDAALLPTATAEVYYPLQLVTGEGLQYDYSFFQHGNQLYIGGYGDEMIKGVTLIASYVAGTEFAIPEAKRDILSAFMLRTWLPSIRGQYLMWNVTGRGMSRVNTLSKNGASIYAERMIAIDPAHAEEYRNAVKRMRKEEPANYGVSDESTHFYRGDYTLHTRANYSANVRLVSTNTKTIEYGNDENLKNYYLSDGSMNIVTHGGEYYDIFPVWDWTRIPGVTAPQRPFVQDPNYTHASDGSSNPYLPHGGNTGNTGTSTFAGGVSDSLYSVTAYNYAPGGTYGTGVGGRKGWFFFDDEIVCLGAAINSNASVSNYDIFTTLNQTHLKGDVSYSVGGTVGTLPAQTEQIYETAPDWVWHDGTGYVFPQGGSVGVSNKTQTGNWYDINLSMPNEPVSGDVFTLYLNHGKAVTNADYAYVLTPGMTANQTSEYAANLPVEILANTDSMQVVHHKGLGIWSMIFYKRATFEGSDIALKTNGPGALILKRQDGFYSLHVASPARASSVLLATRIPATAKEWKSMTCSLSTGNYAGSSKAYTIIPQTTTGITGMEVDDPVVSVHYYNLLGQFQEQPLNSGVYLEKKIYASKKAETNKILVIK
jgi:chondroitin AC lyase